MITENDLREAIAACQGERNPTSNTCIKLAAYYTILDHLQERKEENNGGYSFSVPPHESGLPSLGGSEFLERIGGRKAEEVLPILDELVEAVSVYNPRLYAGFMDKL